MSPAFRLGLISLAALFLELLLVRWLGVELRIFAYFKNLVLIGCIVGLGGGAAWAARRPPLSLAWSALGTAILVSLTWPVAGFKAITERLAFADSFVWSVSEATSAAGVALGVLQITLLFLLLAVTMVPLGMEMGRGMAVLPDRLQAYSINIGGSLLGILLFTALNGVGTPPPVWFAVAGLLLLILTSHRVLTLAAVAAAVVLSVTPPPPDLVATRWSPYQKINLLRGETRGLSWYWVTVNDTGFLWMLDLSDRTLAQHPWIVPQGLEGYHHYALVHRFRNSPGDVLVVGAGGGNDVAAALREGATTVDAVEIDPAVAELGRQYHPEAPYRDPRVRLVVDDARHYFNTATRQYDTIVFGLLDAHTLTSNLSNVGLDSYVYTLESVRSAARLLRPGGHLCISFEVQSRPWVARRLFDTVAQATASEPLLLNLPKTLTWDTTTKYYVIAGPQTALQDDQVLQHFRVDARTLPTAAVTTDDWPYLYLQHRGIPTLTQLVLGVLLLLTALVWTFLLRDTRVAGRERAHFLLLGGGFLLVETHLISRGAILYGATWQSTAAVLSAVMVGILGANLLASRLGARPGYLLLGLGLVLILFVPSPFIAALPVLGSGLVFADSLKRTSHPDIALGWNLLGCVLGGFLESLSTAVGLNAVTALALLVYAAAVLCRPARIAE